ncbi:MAG TPA: gamma-glutamylcyclotransferase family protein [Thermoanaerobaculia bacterium]|nr:gamma-glutamylcyclotransferase family protein [Thermoanaerobaculia bacterium]
MSDRIFYFAYGSNMLSWRLRHPRRCESARKVAVGRLDGFALRFHKLGSDGSGKCDVAAMMEEPTADGPAVALPPAEPCVHGVVYEVGREELLQLDAVEGHGYERREVAVRIEGEARTEVFLPAVLYAARASAIDSGARPYTWYRDLVVAGAREHALDGAYSRRLSIERAIIDPDSERDARERRAIDAIEQWLVAAGRVAGL